MKLLRTGRPGRHFGFHVAWKSVERAVLQWIKEVPEASRKLVLTGHSLGGALAILMASEIHERYPVASVVTFGAPRVGGRKFVEQYEPIDDITWRFENGTDFVSWISPRLIGYRHVGNRVPMSEKGEIEFPRKVSSTWGERNAKRPKHNVVGPVEKAWAAVSKLYKSIPEEIRFFLYMAFLAGLNSAGGFLEKLFWPAVFFYLGYQFFRFVRWRIRRRWQDVANHKLTGYLGGLSRFITSDYGHIREELRKRLLAKRLSWMGDVAPREPIKIPDQEAWKQYLVPRRWR